MFEPTEENAKAIAELIGRGAAEVLRTEDFAALRSWVAREAPAVVPALFATANSERGLRAGANAIAISIWNASPLRSHGYHPRPLPAPGRNDPCSCGSGDKFKRCCGQVSSEFPRVPEEDAWRLLAGHLTNDDLARCVNDPTLPPEPLALLAGEMRERGAGEGARAALAQRLSRPVDLDERHAGALDLLLDLESGARELDDFVDFASRLAERLPQPLQATVYRHLVSAAILAREFDDAHELLELMRAADPDDPTLGPLEVTALLVAGEHAQAAERARFWLAWLRRRGLHEEMPGAIEMLEQAVRDPEAAARELRADEYPFLEELAEIVARAAERPARPYALDTADGGSVLARPPRGVQATEQAWRSAWPEMKPELVSLDVELPADRIEDPEPWLDVLRENADAFDSLDVLDDLVQLVGAFVDALDPGWDGPLLAPLLARAANIVRVSLAPLGAGARVPWSCPANRPALRLLSCLGDRLERLDRLDAAAAVYEDVLRWNPADDQGHRGWLVNHCLRRGDDTRALEFAQHFSDDDRVETSFGLGLALWRLGRRPEAEDTLRAAAAEYPRVVTALVDEEMPEPETTPGFVECGGEDEAWFYREEMREAWLATPEALAFLGGLAKSSAGRPRRAPRARR